MTLQMLDARDASPILELASERVSQGWAVFTCSAPAEEVNMGFLGGSKSFDLGPLIQSVEALGWVLSSIGHVTVPRSSSDTSLFFVRAQLLFRRAV